jgi:hypothetical protein
VEEKRETVGKKVNIIKRAPPTSLPMETEGTMALSPISII